MPSVALYARVSTTDKKQTPETQLGPLRELVARHGWRVYKEYVESISAVKKRPIFEEMLRDARERRFDVLIVWKIDRFARSVAEFANTVRDLDSHGIRFISMTQGIDTDKSNSANRLMMNILVSIAEFERELISERVRAGILRSKAKGGKFGRHLKIFDVVKALERQGEGWSYAKIAKEQGVSTATAFDRMSTTLIRKEI